MKILSKAAIGAALILGVGAMIQPAWGGCTTARTVGSSGAYLVSNPDWGGAGGTRTCLFGYGCYANDPKAGAQRRPISPKFNGSFWAFPGFGDPGPGGIDNGTWTVDQWSKQVTVDFGQPYYYAAFLTTHTGRNGDVGNPPSWGSDARIDGCITDAFTPGVIDSKECTCVLLTDEWDGVGYFAVLSSFTNAIGDFDITPSTADGSGAPTIRLSPLEPANIVALGSPDGGARNDFVTNAGVLNPESLQTDGACDCGIAYKTYAWRTGRGAAAPTHRDAFCTGEGQLNCWAEAKAADGGVQQPTPINGTKADAIARVDCNPAVEEDLYLATRLVLDPASGGGFSAGNVSANSPQVACGATANVTEPNRPDRVQPRGRSDQAPRGQDGNRGRGDR